MYVRRFAGLLETHKCTSVACVLLSFLIAFYPSSRQRRIRLDVRSAATDDKA